MFRNRRGSGPGTGILIVARRVPDCGAVFPKRRLRGTMMHFHPA
ncbi:hypothetical protein HMPREF3036_01434 [Sutterella sp. KLE1602]|nr:hypothetical protein HMPREF3036_01434 [Sutterella sp. KLE1602]